MSFLENAEPWRKNLIVSHMALLAASGVYTLCAWTTEDTCYMVPCYEGVGLETVWKVSQWSTVTAVVAGLYCTIVAGTGFCLFSKYLSEYTGSGDAHLVHGLFAGLPRAYPHHLGDVGDEDLATAQERPTSLETLGVVPSLGVGVHP